MCQLLSQSENTLRTAGRDMDLVRHAIRQFELALLVTAVAGRPVNLNQHIALGA